MTEQGIYSKGKKLLEKTHVQLGKSSKPADIMTQLTKEGIQKQFKEYSGKLVVLKQTLDKAVSDYRQLINQVYTQAMESAKSNKIHEVLQLKTFMEEGNTEITSLLNTILGFLEKTRGNVELEREALEKLVVYLDNTDM